MGWPAAEKEVTEAVFKGPAVAEIDCMDARYKEELALSEQLEAMEARTEAQEARRVADRSTRAARQEANRADPTTGQV